MYVITRYLTHCSLYIKVVEYRLKANKQTIYLLSMVSLCIIPKFTTPTTHFCFCFIILFYFQFNFSLIFVCAYLLKNLEKIYIYQKKFFFYPYFKILVFIDINIKLLMEF